MRGLGRHRTVVAILAALVLATFTVKVLPAIIRPVKQPAAQAQATTPKTAIVTASKQQFAAFIRRNHLTTSDYSYNSALGSYVVHHPAAQLDASGVQLQPSYIYHAVTAPTDSLSSSQYALPLVSAPAAWNTTTGSSNTIVAVIDTGFALSHDGLTGKWWTAPGDTEPGWSFVNNNDDVSAGTTDPNSPDVSHGTMTASVAAAGSSGGTSIAGLCPACTIMPIQVLSDDGVGNTSTVASGVRYAADNGADVISLSLGSTSSDPVLQDAINYALSKNIVVVAAAGNSGPGNMLYPALYPGVVAVGATDAGDNLASWSSTGPQLSVVAPGVNVLADTWSSGNQTSDYGYASGTSLATPMVAGIAGLLHSLNPGDSYATIDNFLTHGVNKVGGMEGNDFTDSYGYGRINANISVLAATLPHPDGTLVQATNDTAIYLIENGTRRQITSPAAFYSQGYSPSQIHLANDTDLALPIGANLDFRPGTLLKDAGSPAVYLTETVGGVIEKAHIASSAVFLGLGYHSVAADALTIPTSELPSATAPDITDTTTHISGTLVRAPNSPNVYLINNGQLSYVENPTVLATYGYTNQQVLPATSADMALPAGPDLVMRNGSLLKDSAPQVYVVVNNQSGYSKRPISSAEIFLGLGYQSVGSDVFTVDPTQLPSQTTTGY